jgi:ribosomal protein S6
VKEAGDTEFMMGELVEKTKFLAANREMRRLKKTPGKAVLKVLGITRVALDSSSFLSAASFQETSRVLVNASVESKVDRLRGLKENVIIGKLIPAGTGRTGIPADRLAELKLLFNPPKPIVEPDADLGLRLERPAAPETPAEQATGHERSKCKAPKLTLFRGLGIVFRHMEEQEHEKNISLYDLTFVSVHGDAGKAKAILGKHGATVVAERSLDKIRLAYPIEKQSYAFLTVLRFSGAADVDALVRELAHEGDMLRSMVTEVDIKREAAESARSGRPTIGARPGLRPTPGRREEPGEALTNEALEKKIEEFK